MSYHRRTPPPAPGLMQDLGSWVDSVKNFASGAASGALSIYSQGQRDAGAAAALQQQLAAQQAQRAPGIGGISPTTLALVGGGILAAVLLARK